MFELVENTTQNTFLRMRSEILVEKHDSFLFVYTVQTQEILRSLCWCFFVCAAALLPFVSVSMELAALIAGASLASFSYSKAGCGLEMGLTKAPKCTKYTKYPHTHTRITCSGK